MTRPKNRAWIANTARALFEVALRITGFSYPSTWRFDEITGKSPIPGAEILNKEESYALIKINSVQKYPG